MVSYFFLIGCGAREGGATSVKRLFGQYYTVTNPFETIGFYKWLEDINYRDDDIILEPFAGANNIPKMLKDDDILPFAKWACFDIKPGENVFPECEIQQRDTIKDYPEGYRIAITNPPYLSKNSATRRGLDYPDTNYDDLYKLCLEAMLNNTPYVAAIIPETFITANLFHSRLHSIISLTCRMFDDTDCPVCLALFVPEKEVPKSFDIYAMNDSYGTYDELKKGDIPEAPGIDWRFNDPSGEVGIWCIDNTRGESIEFGDGAKIDSSKIKTTSRSLTRVGGLPSNISLSSFTKCCNGILEKYRRDTKDVFMASFKGLRVDGLYRRRLDFATARRIMNQALLELKK